MKINLPFWCGAMAFAFALSIQAQNVTVESGTIDSSRTWSLANSPYEITSNIEVAAGVTLVIEPGVEIRVARYANFAVSGVLIANGTAEASILWRGTTDSAGWWQGIQLNDGADGAFNHCRIENAGYASQAALEKLGDGNLTIQNSAIANNSAIGLWINTSTAAVTSSGNQFLNNATGVRLSIGASFNDDASVFSENTLDVQMDGGNIANEVTLNIHSNYSIFCAGSITIQPTGIINILPDTTLKMARYSRLIVDGELNALGSASDPIHFTHWQDDTVGGDANHDGSASAPGSSWWQGILVRDAGSAEMTHCSVRYSGYSSSPGIYKTGTGSLVFNNGICTNHAGDGIIILNSSAPVEILDSTFTNNGGAGMRLQNSPAVITDCRFDQNSGHGLVQTPDDIVDFSENYFTSNAAGSVLILAGEMSVNRHWTHGLGDDEFAIDLSGNLTVAAGVPLEVDPGIIVRVARYALLKVDGDLTAIGSSEEPIQFIGSLANKNHWQGLRLSDGATGNLVFCVIKDAGYSNNAALQKLGSGDLTLQNCTLRDSGNNGLYVQSSAATLNDSNNQYINNGTGVRLAIGVSLDDPGPLFQDNGLDVLLEGGDIESDVVWSLDPAYSIFYSANVTVKPNASLTLGAGTVIKVARYSRLFVDGTLIAGGSAEAPIFWTHWEDDTVGGDANRDGSDSAPEASWWQGISVRDNADASLDYCHIRYGGYSSTPGLVKTGAGLLMFNNGSCSFGSNDGLSISNLSDPAEITNSSFNQNAGSGLRVSNAPSMVSGNLFESNAGFGLVQKSNDLVDYSLNTFSSNTAGSVQVLNGSISVDHHWTHGQGDPVFTVDLEGNLTVDAGAGLVVHPGVIVRVARYAAFNVNGTLTSVGEPENPVQFIGSQSSAGWWQGIKINDTASADFQFSRVADSGYSSGPGILLNGSGGSLNLANNVIENNSGDGIRISGTYASFGSANNTFRNNGLGASIQIGATLDDTSSVFEGNGSDIQLAGGTIARDTTWNVSPGLSLLLAGSVTVNSDTTLTVGSGTTIKVPRYSILTINGTLSCSGEAGAPIQFVGSTQTPGWWQGISVTGSGSANMAYCEISNSGYSNQSGLAVTGSGALNLEYSRLHHNSGNGLLIHDHSGPSNIAHSLFESNGTGVRVTSNTNQPVALTLCGIYDNNVGVNNTGTDNLDARSCWWGDASGPQHPELNPDGAGNSVSDKVLFDPWKLDASLIHPWISVTEVVLYLIALAESKVELSWSDQFPEAQLQSSSDFLIWETVDQAPTLSEGRYRVTLDQIEEGTMGFRIHP